MDGQRIILIFALVLVLLLIAQAWVKDYPPPELARLEAEAPAAAALPAPPAASDVPAPPAPEAPPTQAAVPDQPAYTGLRSGERIRVTTDLLAVELDTLGGDLRQADLLAYPVESGKPEIPFRLAEDEGPRIFIAQSGLVSAQGGPDHHALYTAEQREYRLAPGADELVVTLRWEGPGGLSVVKTYTFHRNSYVIDVAHRLVNGGAAAWTGHQYRQFQRSAPGKDESSGFVYTYTGGVIYNEADKYEKIKFDQMAEQDLARSATGGWAAMIQHYFLGAWIPEQDETNQFYTKAPPGRPYLLGLVSPERQVAAGGTTTFTSRLYVGPKEHRRLVKVVKGLELTVDFGMLTVLSQPLFWLLTHIHDLLGNWGWSIVLLTLIIKLAFYKLSEKSYRSMASMRRLQPRMAAIKERYGDDRQRMTQAMMDLYKREKINPLGGCLPVVVQIPVFIALYWVLLESVELRQATFGLWLHDLSVRDPYFVLPLLMGVTMFMQQRLNPAPPDPIQAKIFMVLPFVFTVFFAFFPAGLVLYWLANNVLSIAQQWYITRRIEQGAAAT